MLIDVLIVVGIAGWEEMVFRGYLVKNVNEGLSGEALGTRWGTVVAVLVPAAFFGWIHASNENATVLSVVNIAIFGILFGVAYVLTGELALPLGLHFAWDFTQGFGFGRSPDPSALGTFLLVEEADAEARLWTGWPSGFEGGLVATAMFALGLMLILAWVRFRRGIVEDSTKASPSYGSTASGRCWSEGLSPRKERSRSAISAPAWPRSSGRMWA